MYVSSIHIVMVTEFHEHDNSQAVRMYHFNDLSIDNRVTICYDGTTI